MKLCDRTSEDPLLRMFVEKYALHLLPVARESVLPGDLIISDGNEVSSPGNIRYLLENEIEPAWTSTNELMAGISGTLSSAMDRKGGLHLLENFLAAFGVNKLVPAVNAKMEQEKISALRFGFEAPLRDAMDMMEFGRKLINNKINTNHPLWQHNYRYYVVSAVVKSASISIVTLSQNGSVTDLDIKELQTGVEANVTVGKNADGLIIFAGTRQLVFGIELHEISINKNSGKIRISIADRKVNLKAHGESAPQVKPALLGGPEGAAFLNFTGNIKEPTHYSVGVFYGTDRNRLGQPADPRYGNERDEMHYGVCNVNIPADKKPGEIPRPTWWKLQFSNSLDKHVFITKTEELEGDLFFRRLSEKIGHADDKDAFVFVHGYNVTFEAAILRCAQIAWDIGFDGAPIVFSWPSKGNIAGYFSDEDNVQYSISHIVQFLKDIRSQTGASRLYLVAHSMGNRALTSALAQLQSEGFFNGFGFNEIILAAPDIDAAIFKNQIAPKLAGCSKRITLYASSRDKALAASRHLRANASRAGETEAGVICCNGIDSIDASRIDTDMIGHGYFAETAPLLTDIFMLFKHDLPPAERNLLEKTMDTGRFWVFR